METTDQATLALTGTLPFVFIAGALIAYPLSRFLLARYRAAVIRTMSATGGEPPRPEGVPDAVSHSGPAGQLETNVVDSIEAGDQLYAAISKRPWLTLCAYAIGGLVYAAILAVALLLAEGMLSPLRLIAMTYIYAWPIVIAAVLIVPLALGRQWQLAGIYFAGLAVLSVVAGRTDLVIAWLLFSLLPTLLVLAFLTRRVRAVGVMVLAFSIISLAGAAFALAVFGSNPPLLRGAASAAVSVGAGALSAFLGIIVLGLVIFGVLAWFANNWIKNRYLRKQLSDQTLLIDSMWLVFAMTQSIGLAFSGAGWYLAGIVAFAFYKVVTAILLRSIVAKKTLAAAPKKLLFLRVFSLGRRSEAVYDAVSAYWRYIGNVRMIAGPDLAVTTVEPHEFLEYLSGRIDQSFIDSDAAAATRLNALDEKPDTDGRYRVLDFFCYDTTWKTVLKCLAADSDAVVMDLRGFDPGNAGVIFELNELISSVPVDKVVLITDDTTDTDFLEDKLRLFWTNMRQDSPNIGASNPLVTICRMAAPRADVRHVVQRLSRAAR